MYTFNDRERDCVDDKVRRNVEKGGVREVHSARYCIVS